MQNNNIFVIGVGKYSIEMAELAEACGYNVAGYYHYNEDRTGEEYYQRIIISSIDKLLKEEINGTNFLLSMGDNKIRLNIAKKLRDKGAIVPSIIHPSVEVSKTAIIEEGVILKRNVTVQSVVSIAKDTTIADNSIIAHHSRIEKGCFIATGAIIGAYTTLKSNVFIGQGAIIPSGKIDSIESGAIVGAGSIVIKNVAKNEVVAGNPAKHIKFNKN